ncbi:siroheme synthase CysG [Buchnera aphidicola (Mindarus keteleerifoliae)]|uniref:siroheme synthase CysG n=1 Tax=Buchnera aphidicola TaxID=9 RepID=UPI0031B71BB4
MNYFPCFINLDNKKVLFVGAGKIAVRKIFFLIKMNAQIIVVSRKISNNLIKLHREKKIDWIDTNFFENQLKKIFLVIVATDNNSLNKYIYEKTKQKKILVNVVDDRSKCTFIFPSIVERFPIIVAVSSGGTAPVLTKMIKEKIESTLPMNLGKSALLAQKWRSHVKLKFKKSIYRRHFWEKIFEGMFVNHVLNGNFKKAIKVLNNEIKRKKVIKGEISLVGAGPGDGGLLTLKGLQVIQKADVVLYDNLVSSEILSLIRKDAKKIYVGKEAKKLCISQEEINLILIKMAKKGKKVVRLKGGDPFIFGRGGEELEVAKKFKINFQVIPGITSAIGVSSYAGIPLTHRNYSSGIIIINGCKKNEIEGKQNWKSISRLKNYTIVIYMPRLQSTYIFDELKANDYPLDMPIALIEQGTTLNQKTVIGIFKNLKSLLFLMKSPTLLILGKVVSLSKNLSWFKSDTNQNSLL